MAERLPEKVDVFDVGKEQLWQWCGHMGRCCKIEGRIVLNDRFSVMDGVSLAKGRYVLVCVSVWFGGQTGGWLVCDSFRSRRKAEAAYLGSVEHVEWSMTRYPRAVAYCEHFELWHVVEDAELWGVWDERVAAARAERCITETNDYIFDNRHHEVVFDVGVRQLRRWCHDWRKWAVRGCCNLVDTEPNVVCSIPKGSWLLVGLSACFGGIDKWPTVWRSYPTLSDAMLGLVRHRLMNQIMIRHESGQVEEYEIWHVVDDDALWGDWQRRVLASRMVEGVYFDDIPF